VLGVDAAENSFVVKSSIIGNILPEKCELDLNSNFKSFKCSLKSLYFEGINKLLNNFSLSPSLHIFINLN
jgi:hypothetical protein